MLLKGNLLRFCSLAPMATKIDLKEEPTGRFEDGTALGLRFIKESIHDRALRAEQIGLGYQRWNGPVDGVES